MDQTHERRISGLSVFSLFKQFTLIGKSTDPRFAAEPAEQVEALRIEALLSDHAQRLGLRFVARQGLKLDERL